MASELRVISLDVWNTLILSNPEFKRVRAEYIQRSFNPKKLSIVDIEKIIRKFDKNMDKICSISGIGFNTDQFYTLSLTEVFGVPPTFDQLSVIKAQIEKLFLVTPPTVMSKGAVQFTKEAVGKGYKLVIACNTGFVSGNMVREILTTLGYPLMDAAVFSDQIGYYKPHPLFFHTIKDKASRICSGRIKPSNILHIGDTQETDIVGAQLAGFQSYKIPVKDPDKDWEKLILRL